MARMSAADISAVLGTHVGADQYSSAASAVTTAITAELPAWCPSIASLTKQKNIDRVDSVFNRVMIRVLTNPAATQSTGVEGLTTTYPYAPGSALTLTVKEKETLGELAPEGSTTQSSSSFVPVYLEW